MRSTKQGKGPIGMPELDWTYRIGPFRVWSKGDLLNVTPHKTIPSLRANSLGANSLKAKNLPDPFSKRLPDLDLETFVATDVSVFPVCL